MSIAPALLEDWFRDYYHEAWIDIGSSGVHSYSFTELRTLANIDYAELDAIVFDDSHSCGAPGLRQAIAHRWGSGNPEWVMATHGSSEAIYLIMNALLRPGDEVVVLEPCYHSLHLIAEEIGCRLSYWHLHAEQQFAPDLEELKRLIGPQTHMIVVNFPHNPTGATVTKAQQNELIAIAEAIGAYLVWDAAFAELVYEQPPLPDPTLSYKRAISFGTLSKGYGLPGLRVGWCLASPEILEACVRLRDYITLALSPMVECVAQRAIEHSDRLLAPRLQQARTNLAILGEWAIQHQSLLEWYPPCGGVTAFPRLRHIQNSEPLCHALLQRHGVLLVPGSCFDHPQHVRLGFGGPTPEFQQGLKHLSDLLVEAAASGEAIYRSDGR